MKLARVVGPVVATVKHPALHGRTTLLCEPVDAQGKVTGGAFVALDHVGAGEGDLVLVNQEGNGARQVFGVGAREKFPVHTVVVGFVDDVHEPSLK